MSGPRTEMYSAPGSSWYSSLEMPVPTTTEFGLMNRPIEPTETRCLPAVSDDAVGDWKRIFRSV